MLLRKFYLVIAVLLGREWILAFELTDKGEDECTLNTNNAQCEENGSSSRETRISRCPDVPTDGDISISEAVTSCCVEEKYVNVSCVASYKIRSCIQGYAWSNLDGVELSRGNLSLQGQMTLRFSPYKLRSAQDAARPQRDPEVMWYKSNTYYSSSITGYGFEIYCNGKIILLKSHHRALIVGIAVGIPLTVTALVVVLIVYCCCYRKTQKRSIVRNNHTEQRSQAYGDVTADRSQQGDSHNHTLADDIPLNAPAKYA